MNKTTLTGEKLKMVQEAFMSSYSMCDKDNNP